MFVLRISKFGFCVEFPFKVLKMAGNTIDTTWSFNKYRNNYDSQEVWELKRSFMQKYQKTIPETELVCLAQTMVNIEVLQCRYPEEMVNRIENMGAKMLKRFRKLRENRVQRTFVDASVAAMEKMNRKCNAMNLYDKDPMN